MAVSAERCSCLLRSTPHRGAPAKTVSNEGRNGRDFAGLFRRTAKGPLGRCPASCCGVVLLARNHCSCCRIESSEFQIPTFKAGAWTLARGTGGDGQGDPSQCCPRRCGAGHPPFDIGIAGPINDRKIPAAHMLNRPFPFSNPLGFSANALARHAAASVSAPDHGLGDTRGMSA